jgi:protein-disulfide isomerase
MNKGKIMKLIILKYGIVAALIIGTIVLGQSKLEGYVDGRVQYYLDTNPKQIYAATTKGIDLLKEAEKVAKGKFVKSLKGTLEQDNSDPFLGNPNADVTVVMFSDYNCGYCKKSHQTLQTALNADSKLRIVIKEFPILGPMSQLAAAASVAFYRLAPEKFGMFQDKMFSSHLSSQQDILSIVESLGIDSDVFMNELPKPYYAQKLNENLSLGERLQINGTPAFVVNGEVYPGALATEELLKIVANARNSVTS